VLRSRFLLQLHEHRHDRECRVLEHMITKLLSHPLPENERHRDEAQGGGKEDDTDARSIADNNAYMRETTRADGRAPCDEGGQPSPWRKTSDAHPPRPSTPRRGYCPQSYAGIRHMPHAEALARVQAMGRAKKAALLESSSGGAEARPAAQGSLSTYYTFDVLVRLRRLPRHTAPQDVHPDHPGRETAHGGRCPAEAAEIGLDGSFRKLMKGRPMRRSGHPCPIPKGGPVRRSPRL